MKNKILNLNSEADVYSIHVPAAIMKSRRATTTTHFFMSCHRIHRNCLMAVYTLNLWARGYLKI